MARTCADFNLRRATRLVSQAFDHALKPCGITITQFSLLVTASMNANIIMHKLAKVMGMDRTTLSRNLALVEKKGLVLLERGEDRREVRIQLTPAGRQALDACAPLWQKTQERISGIFGPEAWEKLIGDLRMLVRNLKQ